MWDKIETKHPLFCTYWHVDAPKLIETGSSVRLKLSIGVPCHSGGLKISDIMQCNRLCSIPLSTTLAVAASEGLSEAPETGPTQVFTRVESMLWLIERFMSLRKVDKARLAKGQKSALNVKS